MKLKYPVFDSYIQIVLSPIFFIRISLSFPLCSEFQFDTNDIKQADICDYFNTDVTYTYTYIWYTYVLISHLTALLFPFALRLQLFAYALCVSVANFITPIKNLVATN